MTDPLILAFDTSAAHCAAALVMGDRVLAAKAEEMGRGQAERLMPMLEELLASADKNWSDLAAIGVGTGPGNFTGIRISVAAARGLALALKIPAIGVTSFEARAEGAGDTPVWVAIDAPRAMMYLQRMGETPSAPELCPETALETLDAPLLRFGALPLPELVANIARIAGRRRGTPQPRPAPLYLRPADAAPMRDAPPVLLP